MVLPTLQHQLNKEDRQVLARVYNLHDYAEDKSRKERQSAVIQLAVVIASRWEPPLSDHSEMKAWEPRGPSTLFTSDRVFGEDWKR